MIVFAWNGHQIKALEGKVILVAIGRSFLIQKHCLNEKIYIYIRFTMYNDDTCFMAM